MSIVFFANLHNIFFSFEEFVVHQVMFSHKFKYLNSHSSRVQDRPLISQYYLKNLSNYHLRTKHNPFFSPQESQIYACSMHVITRMERTEEGSHRDRDRVGGACYKVNFRRRTSSSGTLVSSSRREGTKG